MLNQRTLSATDADVAASPLRAGRIDDEYKALGVAVSLLMSDANFARLPFGQWSRVLAGQIRRRHYLFVVDGKETVGFLGWALTDEAHAERWLAGEGELSFENSLAGECLLINAWLARSNAVNRFILGQIRSIGKEQTMVYAKRFYGNRRVRKVKLPVNAFVGRHIERLAALTR